MTELKQASGVTEAAPEKTESPKDDLFVDFDFSKLEASMDDMFRSGVHFGHHKSRKNPKMEEFIFGVRNSINIFDLQKTVDKLKEASEFISKTVESGQDILFVGTKKQARKLVESAAKKCAMPYVTERWLGGTFTNFGVISKRTRFLREGQDKMKKGEYAQYTKFEQMKIMEELERLDRRMGGIKEVYKLPGAIFVIGVIEDELAIKEARKKGIPVVAVADSNVNPQYIDYPIPANDDAVSAIKLILAYAVKAVLEGKKRVVSANEVKQEKEAEK